MCICYLFRHRLNLYTLRIATMATKAQLKTVQEIKTELDNACNTADAEYVAFVEEVKNNFISDCRRVDADVLGQVSSIEGYNEYALSKKDLDIWAYRFENEDEYKDKSSARYLSAYGTYSLRLAIYNKWKPLDDEAKEVKNNLRLTMESELEEAVKTRDEKKELAKKQYDIEYFQSAPQRGQQLYYEMLSGMYFPENDSADAVAVLKKLYPTAELPSDPLDLVLTCSVELERLFRNNWKVEGKGLMSYYDSSSISKERPETRHAFKYVSDVRGKLVHDCYEPEENSKLIADLYQRFYFARIFAENHHAFSQDSGMKKAMASAMKSYLEFKEKNIDVMVSAKKMEVAEKKKLLEEKKAMLAKLKADKIAQLTAQLASLSQ